MKRIPLPHAVGSLSTALAPTLVVLTCSLASCSESESQAGGKAPPEPGRSGTADEPDHWSDARDAAADAFAHLRAGLTKSVEDAREYWDANKDEWREEVDRKLDRLGEGLEELRGRAEELMPAARERASKLARDLAEARDELATLLERTGELAQEEWAEKSEAVRRRILELEKKIDQLVADSADPPAVPEKR